VGPLGRLLHWKEIQIAGQARGHHAMAWTNGHFGDTISGDGEMVVTPPAGTDLAGAVMPANLKIPARTPAQDESETRRRLGLLGIGGDATYHMDPEGLDFSESWAATPTSYVAFHGRYTSEGGRLNMPVHLTSYDAQESDRLLAAILTERGSATNVIPVGGAFTFDGKLTESFAALRAAGRFAGESIYAFKNTWGRTTGDIVLHDNGVDITNGLVTGAAPGSRLDIDGRFALGYRKEPTVEEMRATIHVEKWPVADFKQSFDLIDWPVDGTGTADLKLAGPYKRLVGDGTLRIDNGVAWREPFESAIGTLRFRGTGLAINPLRITKGLGVIRGDASINWTDSTYTFNVDGAGVRVDTLANFSSEKAKLTGVMSFTAEGHGPFASPAYSFKGSIPDLFVADQGIGAVGGTLTVRDRVVTINQIEVADPAGLGQASGYGTIKFDDHYTSDLSLTVASASIDPYLKFFTDASWFQYTRLTAGGFVRIRGPLAEPGSLDVVANIDDARLKLFDYELHNGAPFALNYHDKSLWIGEPRCTNASLPSCHLELLSGDGTQPQPETQLQLSGSVSGSDSTIDLLAQGSASLAILRAFKGFGDVVASGSATLEARLAGDYSDPHFSGRADIKDGRLKFPWLPRTLEGLNGPITINPTGVNFDGLRGQMGEGDVAFGGTIGFRDYRPEEFNLTLTGSGVTLRGYPRGFDSTVTANLWLRGPFESPLLGGDVDVTKVRMQQQIEPDVSLIAMAAAGGSSASADAGAPIDSTIVVRSEVHIHAVPMRLIDTKNLWITGSTSDLVIGGTIDKPVISGRIDVIAGKWFFSGNQFNIQPGSIEFSNPMKFDPYLNLQAEASTRGGGGQRYQVKVHVTGSLDGKPRIDLSSEPWMSQNDILAVLLGATPNFNTADLRNLRDPQQYEAQLMATLTAQFLVAQSGVSSIFEKTLPLVDTVQFTPTMLAGGDVSLQSLNPNARVTIGKRLSEKLYLIYSRDLNTSSAAINEVYLLQFDQNNRLQWILSRNEDRSFALDFRFRHIF
jgi:translocation and assembly module TamB